MPESALPQSTLRQTPGEWHLDRYRIRGLTTGTEWEYRG